MENLKCPNCGSIEFVEQAYVPYVCRDCQVPTEESQPVKYGHEYSEGDIESIDYACKSCGHTFTAHAEEEFREELQILNNLFNGPVWYVRLGEIIQGKCTELGDPGRVYMESDTGDIYYVDDYDSLYKTKEDAEKALKKTFEYHVEELLKKIDEEKETLKRLEDQLEQYKKEEKGNG